MGQIETERDAVVLTARGDAFDVVGLTGVVVDPGKHHEGEFVSVLIDRPEDVFITQAVLPFARFEDHHRIERLEAFGRSLLDRAAGLSLVVSCHAGDDFTSRMELADRLGARGVHVGGGETGRVAEAREILGEDMLIGYSAHSAAEAADAFEQGASYVSLSPVFLPLSKTGEFQPLGLEELGRACSRLPGPVYALGGVTPAAASSIKDMGAAGVAVITAILEADDPAGVSRRIQAPWGDRATG